MKNPPIQKPSPQGFTLIELLVVVSIIALLATMGTVGGQIVIKRARNLQAQAVMQGFVTAVKQYKTEYLRLPSAGTSSVNEDNEGYDTSDEDGKALLDVLLSVDIARNPRQITFWEPPTAKSGGAGYSTERGLIDPWNKNGYIVLLDYDGNKKITNPYAGGTDNEPEELHSDVVVYCAGANMIFEESGSGSGKKSDDVKSWQ